MSERTWHAYIHVPFCRVRCGYCDFNTYTSTELKGYAPSRFLDHLKNEIDLAQVRVGDSNGRALQSIFFGGGTPTLLPASDLAEAVAVLRDSWGLAEDAEVTTEANPDTVDEKYLAQLQAGGINRISFGMQSAVPHVLATLDRTHNPENVGKSVAAAKNLGLATSVDLIYGTPGESFSDWQRSVEAALTLDTDHISAYSLILEEGTKLYRQVNAGALPQPDEDLEAQKYEYADAAFASAGLRWYELSNWSKGAEQASVHNLAYWTGQDWWGFGPGAHSFVDSVRWWNVKHPTSYARALSSGELPIATREVIDANTALVERVMLEIRLERGVEANVVKELNPNAASAIAAQIASGTIQATAAFEGRLKLTIRGRLLADAVIRDLLGYTAS